MSKRSSHSPWSRPLADLVDAVIDPVLARHGFGESQIVLYWEDIVGERLAAMSEPLALKWPPRGPARTEHAPATLLVRVETGFALELQHLAAIVIERVNGYLGFACIDRLALRQGPVTRRAQAARKRPPPPRLSLRPKRWSTTSAKVRCARPWLGLAPRLSNIHLTPRPPRDRKPSERVARLQSEFLTGEFMSRYQRSSALRALGIL